MLQLFIILQQTLNKSHSGVGFFPTWLIEQLIIYCIKLFILFWIIKSLLPVRTNKGVTVCLLQVQSLRFSADHWSLTDGLLFFFCLSTSRTLGRRKANRTWWSTTRCPRMRGLVCRLPFISPVYICIFFFTLCRTWQRPSTLPLPQFIHQLIYLLQ